MSDEDPTSDDGDSGLVERVGESLGFDIERIKAELRGDSHETDPVEESTGPVHHPTDESIVELAVDALVKEKQREMAEGHSDVEDPRNLKVEVDISDPNIVLHEFAQALYEEREDILAYLYNNSLFDVTGPSLEADQEELVTYIIEERNEDAERPAAFLGGAQPVRLNLADREDLTEDERRLVKKAHTVAARRNGYDRHLLLDEVLVIPLEDPGRSPYGQGPEAAEPN